jgi:hypothetical protein
MPLNIKVTQFPDGIGTVTDDSVLNSIPSPINIAALAYNEFDQNDQFSNIWALNSLGVGGATDSRLASASGVLRQTTGIVAGEGQEYNANAGGDATDAFVFASEVESWFGARFRIDTADLSTIILGWVPEGSALAPLDGVYFSKPTGDTEAFLIVENSGAAQSSISLGDIAADTWYDLGIFYNGEDKVSCQVRPLDGSDGLGGILEPGSNLPSVGLDPTFTVATGAAAAVIFDLDYVLFGGGR